MRSSSLKRKPSRSMSTDSCGKRENKRDSREKRNTSKKKLLGERKLRQKKWSRWSLEPYKHLAKRISLDLTNVTMKATELWSSSPTNMTLKLGNASRRSKKWPRGAMEETSMTTTFKRMLMGHSTTTLTTTRRLFSQSQARSPRTSLNQTLSSFNWSKSRLIQHQ